MSDNKRTGEFFLQIQTHTNTKYVIICAQAKTTTTTRIVVFDKLPLITHMNILVVNINNKQLMQFFNVRPVRDAYYAWTKVMDSYCYKPTWRFLHENITIHNDGRSRMHCCACVAEYNIGTSPFMHLLRVLCRIQLLRYILFSLVLCLKLCLPLCGLKIGSWPWI